MLLALIQNRCELDRSNNLTRALEGMERAKSAGAQMVVFPELAVDRFFPQHPSSNDAATVAEPIPGPTANAVSAKAKELSLVTVFNMYEEADGKFFDSSPVFDADGKLLGVTRMVHITDYACFHEQAYYHPGDRGAPVYDTAVGRIGVAICYDGLFEAEVRTAAFQNGYFAALCNRVGKEERLTFAGESFVVDPSGRVVARAKPGEDDLLLADINLADCPTSHAHVLFWRDRRPDLYGDWLA
jgi:N-carbamoylputrescine amidase